MKIFIYALAHSLALHTLSYPFVNTTLYTHQAKKIFSNGKRNVLPLARTIEFLIKCMKYFQTKKKIRKNLQENKKKHHRIIPVQPKS